MGYHVAVNPANKIVECLCVWDCPVRLGPDKVVVVVVVAGPARWAAVSPLAVAVLLVAVPHRGSSTPRFGLASMTNCMVSLLRTCVPRWTSMPEDTRSLRSKILEFCERVLLPGIRLSSPRPLIPGRFPND